VTRAVDQLEHRGLVERCVFEGDKRGYLATLTPEGRAFLRKATNVHLQGLREHFLNHLKRPSSGNWPMHWRRSSTVRYRLCCC
jgi:DNA-binding MarR family transcriptional regulator